MARTMISCNEIDKIKIDASGEWSRPEEYSDEVVLDVLRSRSHGADITYCSRQSRSRLPSPREHGHFLDCNVGLLRRHCSLATTVAQQAWPLRVAIPHSRRRIQAVAADRFDWRSA